ncbi:MAG: peptidylprolyl isomerase [Pseudomonadota bacterium]
MKGWLRGLVTVGSALVLAACGGEAPEAAGPAPLIDVSAFDGQTVASVNGEIVPEEILLAYLRMSGKIDADPAAQQAALVELVDLLLLAQAARADGLLDRSSTQAELAVQRVSWIANQALARFAEANPVTEDEIAAEYELQVVRTGRQEYKLRHLLAASREEAEGLAGRLGTGTAFETLEAEQVGRLGAAAAGQIDWVNLAQVPPAFGPAVSELAAGEFTRIPVQSEYGWHVILLDGVRPFEPPALDTVRDGIRATLARRKIEAHLASLRSAGGPDPGGS